MISKLTPFILAAALVALSTACKKSSPAPSARPQNADSGAAGAAEPDQAGPPQGEPTARPDNPSIKVPPPGPPMVVRGVTVNVDKTEQALRSAPFRVFQYLDNVRYSLHYEDFNTTLMDYQKVMEDPGITDYQKSVIAGVMEQVKQAAAAPAQ